MGTLSLPSPGQDSHAIVSGIDGAEIVTLTGLGRDSLIGEGAARMLCTFLGLLSQRFAM